MGSALHLATTTDDPRVLHAAADGDHSSVCGHPLDLVWADSWDGAPADLCCERCRHAVEVLRLISAV